MRKIVYLIFGLSALWLAKLSYDVTQYSQTIPQLQQQLAQTEQRYALLNDQLIAVQRQLQNGNVTDASDTTTPIAIVGIAPIVLIKQQLQLVQFALDQQQVIYALDHLTQLQQHLAQYAVSPALQHSLIKAIAQDKQDIQQFVLTQTQQQQQLDSLLQQLDQTLQQDIQNPKVLNGGGEKSGWWRWFKLEKVQRAAPDLINRALILKEVQLRLLLASQALKQGQDAEYRQSIQESMQLLATLPDQNSQRMKLRLEKILNLSVIPTPKLTTLSLLG